MTLILSLDDVKSVLAMGPCIDAVEEAFRQYSLGNVVQPTRPTIKIAAHRALINAMPAYIGGVEALGVKWVGGYLGKAEPLIGLVVESDVSHTPTVGDQLTAAHSRLKGR